MFSWARECSEEEKAWWAVQPVKEVDAPNSNRLVDGFVIRKLEEVELKLTPEASPDKVLAEVFGGLIHGKENRERARVLEVHPEGRGGGHQNRFLFVYKPASRLYDSQARSWTPRMIQAAPRAAPGL